MKNSQFLLAVILLFLVSGCNAGANANAVKEPEYREDISVEVHFCPKENCTKIILNKMNVAEKSLHCAFFELDSGEIIKAIAKKSHSAEVKVVIDKGNYEGQIKGNVRLAESRQYMHNKFCIIDKSIVITGSTNPTYNGLNHNNENTVIIKSAYIAENYEDEFDELWNGVYSSGDKVKYEKIFSDTLVVENYFCPEDDCAEKVIKALSEAEHNIYFMTFSFTDEGIADAMLFSRADIKGVFESRGSETEYSQYPRLKGFGIDVVKDKNPRTMHHKVFIIDNKTVITGSYNPTGSGNRLNDENVLVIRSREIASMYLKEFESLR